MKDIKFLINVGLIFLGLIVMGISLLLNFNIGGDNVVLNVIALIGFFVMVASLLWFYITNRKGAWSSRKTGNETHHLPPL